MKIDPNSPAFPRTGNEHICPQDGLPIRAHFALELMKGMVASTPRISLCLKELDGGSTANYISQLAVEHADALIAALNKEAE